VDDPGDDGPTLQILSPILAGPRRLRPGQSSSSVLVSVASAEVDQ